MNKDTAGVVSCWAACDLMRAWELEVKLSAHANATKLFPNLAAASDSAVLFGEDISPSSEDETAGALGRPFTEIEAEEEWEGWVNWE